MITNMLNSKINAGRITNIFLGFIASFLGIIALMELSTILIPFTFAVLLTFIFHPVVIYAKKYKIPKSVSIFLILVFVFGAAYFLLLVLVSSIQSMGLKSAFYSEKINSLVVALLQPFNLTLKDILAYFDFGIDTLSIGLIVEKLFQSGLAQKTFISVSAFLGDVIIILVFWLFMIFGKENFDIKLKFAFGKEEKEDFSLITGINAQVQSYIFIKTIISFLTALVTTVILTAFGVDFALFWGFLTFSLNYIPNIGSIVATIFPIAITFLQFGFGIYSVLIVGLLSFNQFLVGNFIEPHYLGKHLNLSPVFVLISLIFWGWVWGMTGMFLAVPIAAILKIVFNSIDELRPISILIGSNPVSTGKDEKKNIT